MKGHLLMSEKERSRLLVMSRVRDQGMHLVDAARVLGVGYRQAKRIYRRFREQGDEGLVHKNRGRPSGRGYRPEFRAAVLASYEANYIGYGPTLAQEKLAEEGLAVDHETLRRWLLGAGLIKRGRKRAPYRERRSRREHFGELVQMDGSHHRWFGEDEEKACLMNMVDDATGTTLSLMAKEETTEIAMRTLWAWIERYGIPEAIYSDKKNVFVTKREPTLDEQLAGEIPLTEFGRACNRLGIEIITANSPQAKGRVERNHGVYQDRLVKELAKKEIKTIASANELLTHGFVDHLNKKFARPPASGDDGHLPPPKNLDLARIFCYEETRVVTNDYTVSLNGCIYQILRQPGLPRRRSKIVVQRHLDGSLHLLHQGVELIYEESCDQGKRTSTLPPASKPQKSHHPEKVRTIPVDHPWKKRQHNEAQAKIRKRTFLTS